MSGPNRRKFQGRPPSKLSEIQVRMIRIWWEDNPEISVSCMACHFNVTETYVDMILSGARWKKDRNGNQLEITQPHPARHITKGTK